MPWTPGDEGGTGARDPRLDPFRERAGTLHGAGAADGAQVLLRVETSWSRTRGHLWWSRWASPREAVHAYLQHADGRTTDWLSSGDDLESDLRDWPVGAFWHAGSTYGVVWQDDAESLRVRVEVFGLD